MKSIVRIAYGSKGLNLGPFERTEADRLAVNWNRAAEIYGTDDGPHKFTCVVEDLTSEPPSPTAWLEETSTWLLANEILYI